MMVGADMDDNCGTDMDDNFGTDVDDDGWYRCQRPTVDDDGREFLSVALS